MIFGGHAERFSQQRLVDSYRTGPAQLGLYAERYIKYVVRAAVAIGTIFYSLPLDDWHTRITENE